MLDRGSTGFVDFDEMDRLLEMFGYSAVSKEMLQKVLGAEGKEINFANFKRLMEKVGSEEGDM